MVAELVLVLVVTVDTLRLDAVDSMPQTSARLRAFHQVSDFRTPSPLTLPAHASLWTGLYPYHHGVRNNGRYRLAESFFFLPERLKGEGFRTAAFVSSKVLSSRYGLARGFDTYQGPPPGVDELPAVASVDEALRFLDRPATNAPTLLWLHLFDPHAPYRVAGGGVSKAPEAYYGEARAVDRELDRLWRWLDQKQLWDRAIVVFCADHGEGLGDHGEPQHGVYLYEPTVRIPFYLHAPGDISLRDRGSLLDVVPTLLELLGLTPAACLDGESLLHPSEQPLLLESVAPREAFGWSPSWGVVWNGHKLVQRDRFELYAVKDDPLEGHDMATTRAQEARVGQALMSEMVQSEALANLEPDPSLVALGYVLPRAVRANRRLGQRGEAVVLDGLNDSYFAASAGDWEAVLTAAEGVLRTDSENVAALHYVVDASGRLGRPVARDRLDKLQPLDDPSGQTALVLARYHEARGDRERAEQLYATAVEQNELLIEARLAVIGQLLARDRDGEALAHVARLEQLAPGSSHERVARALVALDQGQLPSARQLLEQVPEDQRNDFRYWVLRGYLAYRSGQLGEAITAFENAIEHGHATPDLLLTLGGLAIELDNTVAAADTFRRFLSLYPSHPEAANVRSLLRDLEAVRSSDPEGRLQ